MHLEFLHALGTKMEPMFLNFIPVNHESMKLDAEDDIFF